METTIQNLGECQFVSPLTHVSFEVNFRSDTERVLFDHTATDSPAPNPTSFELSGPREKLFFDPGKTTAAIVTCGGLCPGLNDIIRALVTQCHNRYGITRTYGFRYGYQGMISRYGFTPMTLRPESVSQIHNFGGSILGASRGPQDIGEMVDLLEEMKVDIPLAPHPEFFQLREKAAKAAANRQALNPFIEPGAFLALITKLEGDFERTLKERSAPKQ
jgi:6-phosphofructokinase 1